MKGMHCGRHDAGSVQIAEQPQIPQCFYALLKRHLLSRETSSIELARRHVHDVVCRQNDNACRACQIGDLLRHILASYHEDGWQVKHLYRSNNLTSSQPSDKQRIGTTHGKNIAHEV